MPFQPIAADVSHHNSTPDFKKAKASGLVAVILKATEGTSYIDDTFKSRRSAAVAAGLIVNTYHFLKFDNVASQMKHYYKTVQPAVGERMVIDYEDGPLTGKQLMEAVRTLLDIDLSLQVTVYGAAKLREDVASLSKEDKQFLKDHTSLWVAAYRSSDPDWAKDVWPTWSLHQYTDGSAGGDPKSFPGFSGPTDLNRFNGSAENAAKWFAPAKSAPPAPEPAPQPEPSTDTVEISLTVPEGVRVSIIINGEKLA